MIQLTDTEERVLRVFYDRRDIYEDSFTFIKDIMAELPLTKYKIQKSLKTLKDHSLIGWSFGYSENTSLHVGSGYYITDDGIQHMELILCNS